MSRVGSWARAWLEGWAARLQEPIRRAGAFALDLWTHYSRHVGLVLAVGLVYLGLVQGRAAPAWLFQPVRLPQAASAQPASPEVLQALLRRSAYLGGTRRNSPALLIRQVDLHTEIPERPRRGIITYTVQSGDTLFGIAEKFKLRPETILWANYDVLQDDPHMLEIGQVLNIPPVDGVLHVVKEGETLEAIAQKYNVSPEAIRNAEWNGLQDGGEPQVGQMLIVPGGTRPFAGWTPPRQAYVVVAGGKRLPSGACPSVQVPPLGTGSFIWPVNSRWRSGYDFTAYHPGVDFAGRLGDPVYAADAGTVVYAGWSTVGYGNLIVLDHGNGYQTYYAHLSAIFVGCGQQVAKGATIGLVGSTGRSTGPHLHFEIRGPGGFVNPWRALP
ncbi:MAG: peptidoglycan DD-metalloendopeptidase family protein [Thermoflexus hugenholtzii]|jgi:murein DD-endopeptidase MepM/ murein hydrolase activator NlpD|uniref:peptidoglycan DD-metalloendopeptidase family protein n=1 Tax=Thermoflexus TaxID=1495649 RepID=UPI001C74404B|nr:MULTISPECIES: M23 family metallopeptidase [Thermoflexus]QWK09977.1 MAG: peptidoglycan DD-metalloendopeptidase family protein [Thermoflexus hugenholtzii]